MLQCHLSRLFSLVIFLSILQSGALGQDQRQAEKLPGTHLEAIKALSPTPSANTITISGYVRDATTGEELIGNTVMIPELQKGTYTNEYGFYSLDMPAGRHELVVTLPSYEV